MRRYRLNIRQCARGLVLSGIGLAATAIAPAGCAIPACPLEMYAEDPRCADPTLPDLAIVTPRLSRAGGPLRVKGKLASGTMVTVELGTGGPRVNVALGADGSAETMVMPEVLASIPFEKTLKVTATAGSVTASRELRVFQAPTFFSTPTASLSTGARRPTGAWVRLGHLFVATDSATDRTIDEYALMGGSLVAQRLRDPLRNSLTVDAAIDISETQVFHVVALGGYKIEYASLTSTTATYTPLASLPYTKITALSAQRQSTLVAAAGQGGAQTQPFYAYSVPQGAQAMVTGAPQGKNIVALGLGELDGDERIDVVALYDDKSLGVFRGKARTDGYELAYDTGWSQALSQTAALAQPAAMSTADLDRDGLEDVLLGETGQVRALFSQGDGTFAAQVLVTTGTASAMGNGALAAGDLGIDGKPDLVLGSAATSTAAAYNNQAQ